MAEPSIFYWNKLSEILGKIAPWAASGLGLLAWFYNIVEVVVVQGLQLITTKVSSIDTSAFGNASFSGIAWIGYINAVFPLSELLGLLAAYYTAWLVFIGLRWIKQLIPTWSN